MPGQDATLYSPEVAFAAASALFGARAKAMEPLSQHGTFGVGGPADVWVSVKSADELARIVAMAVEHRFPLLLLAMAPMSSMLTQARAGSWRAWRSSISSCSRVTRRTPCCELARESASPRW